MSGDDEWELPEDVAALLQSEREIPRVSPSRRERIEWRLQSALATTSTLALVGVGLRWGRRLVGSKWTLMSVAVVSVVSAGLLYGRPRQTQELAHALPARTVAAVNVSAGVVSRTATPEPRALPQAATSVQLAPVTLASNAALRPPELASADARSDAALAAERRLLMAARASLRAGDVRSARSALAAHRAQFPNGRLASERETLLHRAEQKEAAP